MLVRRLVVMLVVLACAAAAAAQAARASNLIDRTTRRATAAGVKLQVNNDNVAVLTYRIGGSTVRKVAAWGAVNAIPPAANLEQQGFKLQYMGVTGRIKTSIVKGTFRNTCRPYRGPKLFWFVTGCTAADGSFWAVQSWQRALPNYGVPSRAPDLNAWELRLSHWSGPLAVLTVGTDWSFGGQFDHFYGALTLGGKPHFGFKTTSYGAPLDKFGILVYLDTFNSAYGKGWKRENSFVTHNPTGIFCYSMNPHGSRPAGKGTKYRMTAIGPGVTPDVVWQGNSPGPYDAEKDKAANEEQAAKYSDKSCRPN